MTLHEAIRKGDTQALAELFASGAEVDALDDLGHTPLWHAVQYNFREEAALLLIAHGADVNVRDSIGYTALMSAAYTNSKAAVRAMLERGADIHSRNDFDETALSLALRARKMEAAAILVEAGAEVRVYEAALLDDAEAVTRLAAQGHNLDAFVFYQTPLEAAAWAGLDNMTALLLRLGATVYNMRDAALIGDVSLIRDMIAEGFDIDAQSSHGITSLMEAATAGRLEAVRALLEGGANIHLLTPEGYTALKWAQMRNQPEIAAFLQTELQQRGEGPSVQLMCDVREQVLKAMHPQELD